MIAQARASPNPIAVISVPAGITGCCAGVKGDPEGCASAGQTSDAMGTVQGPGPYGHPEKQYRWFSRYSSVPQPVPPAGLY